MNVVAQLSASLDTAWQEAVEALPEGWAIGGVQWEQDDDPTVPDDWHAWAGPTDGHCRTCKCTTSAGGRGETPAAALHALALALRAGATS